MGRVYGFLGGVVTGLCAVYGSVSLIQKNTNLITRELRKADDVAQDRPKVLRPYTDPIDLETRGFKDTIVDVWDREVVRGYNYIYSLTKKQ